MPRNPETGSSSLRLAAVTIVIAGGSGFLGRKLAQTACEPTGTSRRSRCRAARSRAGRRRSPGSRTASPGALAAPSRRRRCGRQPRRRGHRRQALDDGAQGRAARTAAFSSTRTLVRADCRLRAPAEGVHQRIGDRLLRTARRRTGHRIDAAGHGLSGAALRRMGSRRRARPQSPTTRLAIVRTGLALDRDGGALTKMLLPFKLGLGATLGIGRSVHAVDSRRTTGRRWCRG